MILHCERCSLGGENMGEHSEVAVIFEDRLRLPLSGGMFHSLYPPETGVGDPWRSDLEWNYMYCPKGGGKHLVFSTPDDDVWEMLERGGPQRILTNKGWIRLLEDGWHSEENGVVVAQIEEAVFACPHCDFVGKNVRSLATHNRMKHKCK